MTLEYIDKQDLDSKTLIELWNQLEYNTNYLSDYVELVKHDSTPFQITYSKMPLNTTADIVSYNDAPILKSGAGYETFSVDPFHVKNAEEYKITQGKVIRTGDGFKLESNALIEGMRSLENYRRNLMWLSVASMVSKKEFAYKNGEVSIRIPYDGMIGDLEAYNGTDNFRTALTKTVRRFQAQAGAPLKSIIINEKTADKILAKPEVEKYFEIIQRDSNAKTNSFVIANVEFIVEMNAYHPAQNIADFELPDNVCVLISDKDNGGHQPIQINRGANHLNNEDASAPHFEIYQVAPSPYTVHLDIYDNFIPTLTRKNAIMHWRLN